MSKTENPLLTKWSTNTGLSSSLMSSGSLSLNLDGLSSHVVPQKRKSPRGRSEEDVEKKKPKANKDLLISSKLTTMSAKTGSDLTSSFLLGKSPLCTSSRQPSTGNTSSLLSMSSTLGKTTRQQDRPGSVSNTSLGKSLLSTGSSLSGTSKLLTSTLSTGLKSSGLGSSLKSSSKETSTLGGFGLSSNVSSTKPSLGSNLLAGSSLQTSVGKANLAGGMTLTSSLLGESTTKTESDKKEKSKGGKSKDGKSRKRPCVSKYEAPPPKYQLTNQIEDDTVIEVPKFVPPEKDRSLVLTGQRLHDVNGLKFALINAVSSSLICQPNFSLGTDPTRIALVTMSQKVICYDPEFILKVALYTRKQLNIRTTANFLLALSSHMPACRPYLRKYFSASIALPSDWIEVAEIYQAFPDKALALGSLPSALRRAMVAKFPNFDKYQLAKYNKESSQKKKKKKKAKDGAEEAGGSGYGRGRGRGRGRGQVGRGRGRGRGRGGLAVQSQIGNLDLLSSDSDSSDSDEEYEKFKAEKGLNTVVFDDTESSEQLEKMTFSLKQLIRKLHITEPVEHVMCLIGKKYPSSLEEFYQSRLPGTFDEERAGKRMKLPVPETWETQVSLKGNKASTWQQLLDHKKLPFMAMLRNLRNLIKAGISRQHHNWVIRKLTDEKSVIYSKQFPFRFFSAYEVLEGLRRDYENSQNAIIEEAVKATSAPEPSAQRGCRGRGRGKVNEKNWWIEKKKKKQEAKNKAQETPYDEALLIRYKKALDTAVKLATVYNVKPIRGRTVILCDIGVNMERPCTAARGLGKPRTMKEVSVLLGLMCKYSCEDCTLLIYNSFGQYTTVNLEAGTILDNMEVVLNKEMTKYFKGEVPMCVLMDMLRDRVQIDNLLLLTGGDGETDTHPRTLLSSFPETYRRMVNPNLLYVNVSFAGKSCGFASEIKPEHENDIYISGFSDQILRFIAERGEGGQLRHVENIDEAFNLAPLPFVPGEKPAPPTTAVEKPLPVPLLTPSWRTARVFISSTFRDMHGERDLLTRFVFPELRALGKKHFINIHEVDLRWGVTEEETRSQKTLELCLTEIGRCQLFVGILGERYGWVPDKYVVPDTPQFDWVRQYPKDRSVTELEMHCAALSQVDKMRDRAFFFIRNDSFESNVPKSLKEDFLSESPQSKTKMDALKDKIRHSGLEVFDRYPCQWGGVVEGKPLVSGLDQFALRALNNLWNGIQKYFPDKDSVLDEAEHTNKLHDAFVANMRGQFVGRKKLMKDVIKMLAEVKSGMIGLVGKPGTGKSALLANTMVEYAGNQSVDRLTILPHFVGAAPGSTNILATLRRLCHELNQRFSLQMDVPEDYKNLVPKFEEMLREAATLCRTVLAVFVDGLDNMDPAHLPHNLDWLPAETPQNVVFILTSLKDGKVHQSLQRRKVTLVTVEGLDMWDKAEVVRSHLATHRKSLDEKPFNNQMKLLVSKKEANIPLYLSLACEELRVFGLFEKITPKLKSLPQTVPLLLQEVMVRLETDLGTQLVSTALMLLVCSRDGLEASELKDLLSIQAVLGDSQPKVMQIANMLVKPEDALPAATFAKLQRSLQGFLNPTDSWSERLCLAHAAISSAVRQRYMKSSGAAETELYLHRLLAGYFYDQADPERDNTWAGRSAQAFSELPYHLAKSGSYFVLEKVVCNLPFIYSKCMMGLATQLINDYQEQDVTNKILEREQAKLHSDKTFLDYKSFVSRNLHILASHPALTWQQAYNEPEGTSLAYDCKNQLNKTSQAGHTSLMEWTSKPDTVDPCYLTIPGLPQVMVCVCVSPDGQMMAGGGEDCLVHLYDINTGKELKSFRGHGDTITDVSFAGNDKLCSASLDSTVSIWHVQDGHRLFTLKSHQRRVNSCSADLSGKLLATASWDCSLKVISVNKGEEVCNFRVGSPVNCVAFHPEGQLIVSGQWDSTIKIWDIFHKTKKAVLKGHKSSVRDVAYSPSGSYIASAALDGDVKLWAAYKGAQVGNIQGHALPINKLVFSPSGKQLITVSDDQKIKVWSGHLGRPVSTLGNKELGPAMSVAISVDMETVVVGYHSGWIRQYDVISGRELAAEKVHTASVRCIQYMARSHIISGADDNMVKILKENLKEACLLTTHAKPVMCIDTCKDLIATASEDCTCCLFENDLKYGPKGLSKTGTHMVTLSGHIAPVTSCTFNKDGSRLATGSRDMSVRIWDIVNVTLNTDATPLQILHDCHADWVTDCKWSNISDHIVTASSDFNLKVWDVKTGKEKFKLTGHLGGINKIGYNSGCIISTCSDGTVKVWSHKGVEITTLYGHEQRTTGCDIVVKLVNSDTSEEEESAWSREEDDKGKILQPQLESVMAATCSDDGTVRMWYPLQANELASMTGHAGKVVSVAASPSGQLCTSSLDHSIRMWCCNVDKNSPVGGHNAPVTFVCSNTFDNGHLVLSGSRDGVMKIWQKSDTGYTCLFTVKGFDHAVTCGQWISKTSFVVGADDCTVSIWKIASTAGAYTTPRKVTVFKTDSPVLSVITNGSQSDTYIISSEWKGTLRLFDLKRPVALLKTCYGFTSWHLKLHWVGGEQSVFLATTTDGYVYSYSILKAIRREKNILTELDPTRIPTDKNFVQENATAHKVPDNWVLDLAGRRENFVSVDSRGQLSFLAEDGSRVSKKIHADDASCVIEKGKLVFTASKDKTIKVWDTEAGWKQVGQFFCQSPVNSLDILDENSGQSVSMVYGDDLGFVHFLSWRQ